MKCLEHHIGIALHHAHQIRRGSLMNMTLIDEKLHDPALTREPMKIIKRTMISGVVGEQDINLTESIVIQSGQVVIDTSSLVDGVPLRPPQQHTVPEAPPTEEINIVRRPSSDGDFDENSCSSVTFAYDDKDSTLSEGSVGPSTATAVATSAEAEPSEEETGRFVATKHRGRFSVRGLLSRLRCHGPHPLSDVKKCAAASLRVSRTKIVSRYKRDSGGTVTSNGSSCVIQRLEI
jgi:hypothetical protein